MKEFLRDLSFTTVYAIVAFVGAFVLVVLLNPWFSPFVLDTYASTYAPHFDEAEFARIQPGDSTQLVLYALGEPFEEVNGVRWMQEYRCEGAGAVFRWDAHGRVENASELAAMLGADEVGQIHSMGDMQRLFGPCFYVEHPFGSENAARIEGWVYCQSFVMRGKREFRVVLLDRASETVIRTFR